MKLKNKKTGEIKDWDFGNWYQTILNPEHKEKYECNLNDFIDRTVKFREEWEDTPEEPKKHYEILAMGAVMECKDTEDEIFRNQGQREIGNYFSSREEAEKAVEKLKAWKRLKDKGFRFTGINDDEDSQELITQCGILCEADIYHLAKDEDFLLLFGGEE